MAVRTITFQVALVIIIVIGILMIIHSAWTISQVNRTNGDDCACSGISDSELNSLRMYSIFMIVIGVALIIYAIVMFLIPTAEVRQEYSTQIRERFYRKTD